MTTETQSMHDFEARSQRLIEAAEALHPELKPCGDFPFTVGIHGELVFWFHYGPIIHGAQTTGALSEHQICPECGNATTHKHCGCKAAEVI